MDERIMKVLEAAGGRIADVERDYGMLEEVNGNLRAEIGDLKAKLEKADSSKMFWWEKCNELQETLEKLEAENKSLKADRANVEAVE